MKKMIGLLASLVMVIVMTGCAHSAGSSVGAINTGYHTRAHAWEKPSLTGDLKSNPVTSELGMGFVTVGSQAGFGDHPTGKWVSLDISIGPDALPVATK